MNTGTSVSKIKVVLDTNVIISAIGFGGKPRIILELVLTKNIQAISSNVLLAELEDVIYKKFPLLTPEFEIINKQLRKNFKIVKPKKSVHILKDEPDNRVLEAAFESRSQYIVTGDKELLELESFGNIKIISAAEFLNITKK
jgi:putative PIN family toxin of toxin-antitoxin system